MRFKDRSEAGLKLAQLLLKYSHQNVIVFGLPRGGVVTAFEISKKLYVPLGLIISRKIGHPNQPEYAIGAVSQNGEVVLNPQEVSHLDQAWLKQEIKHQRQEAKRRSEAYIGGKTPKEAKGKIVILTDDGVATGFTMLAAIKELKRQKPERITVAVPVISEEVAQILKSEGVTLVALDIEEQFSGNVGSYYENFQPVEDETVIELLKKANF